jgi:hypothetical protein
MISARQLVAVFIRVRKDPCFYFLTPESLLLLVSEFPAVACHVNNLLLAIIHGYCF